MLAKWLRCGWAALGLAGVLVTAMAPKAVAAAPNQFGIDGVLTTNGGGPAVDGTYPATFQILDGPQGATLWNEGPLNISVKNGLFSVLLGSKAPLGNVLAGGDRWLLVQFASDPALPPVQLRAVPFALRAGVAESLDCSGCIQAGQLAPSVLQPYAKTADLTPYAKTADLSAYAKTADIEQAYPKSASLHPVAASGSYLDLKDKPQLADVATSGTWADLLGKPASVKLGASCGTGLVVAGIAADGTYTCVPGFNRSMLPKDSLADVSNGLLTNRVTETAASSKVPLDLADAQATSDSVVVPDLGACLGVQVAVQLKNSTIAQLRVTLSDPQGKTHTLHDQSGSGTTLSGVWPQPDKLVAGDLAAWAGQNPKGTWTLTVTDLAGKAGQADGQLLAWSVQVLTLSSNRVAATAGLQLAVTEVPPVTCQPSTFGTMYASAVQKAVMVCNGAAWYPIGITAFGAKDAPVLSCKDLLAKSPTAKSGVYWIDPDGPGAAVAFEAYCEMTLAGGGWTLLFNLDSADGIRHSYDDTAFWTTAKTEGSAASALSAGYKSVAFSSLSGAQEALVLAHDNGATKGWAAYDLVADAKGKTLLTVLSSASDYTWTAPRKQASGSVGAKLNTKRPQTKFGDPFIDNPEAVVVNKQSGWSSDQNKMRLATTLTNSDYGHTFGGLGGSHRHSGWGEVYESAPIASYCDCTNLYGAPSNNGTNGQPNSITTNDCYDPAGFQWLPIDMAVWVR